MATLDLASVERPTVDAPLLLQEIRMISFQVDDMTCEHCVSTITKALKAADRDAKVQIDLDRHLVHIEPGDLDTDELGEAIREAGYTPTPA
jgi:copper chaperone